MVKNYFESSDVVYEPSISHLAQIWAKMPIFLWKSGPYLGHWFIYGRTLTKDI